MNGAQLHLLINHVPVVGTLLAVALLLAARRRRCEASTRSALGLLALVACTALPAYLSGDGAEHVTKSWVANAGPLIEEHEDAASWALALAMTLGALALTTLSLTDRHPQWAQRSLLATMLLGLVTVGSMAYTAHLGGLIRHPEIVGAGVPPAGLARGAAVETEEHERH